MIRKVTGLKEVAGAVLLCPTTLPDRTLREHDSKSYRLEDKQRTILPLCVFLLTQLFTF